MMNPPVECILSRVIVLRHGYTVLSMLRIVHSLVSSTEEPRTVRDPSCRRCSLAVPIQFCS